MDEKTTLLGGTKGAAIQDGLFDVPSRPIKRPISAHPLVLAIGITTTFFALQTFLDNFSLPCVEFFGCRPRIEGWPYQTSCGSARHTGPESGNIWDNIEPSMSLEYIPCFDGYQCSRLEVPLDWNSTRPNSARATLAIIKKPAKVDVTHPSYGGAILFNPGGPGGGGVEFMLRFAPELSTVLDTDLVTTGQELYANQSRFYDLISWDPRGVDNTRPIIEGYASKVTRIQEAQRFLELADSLEHPEIFNRLYESQGIFGQLIAAPQDGVSDEEHPARFSGTTSVVRDMVEIIEKHGEWREAAAEEVIQYKQQHQYNLTLADEADIRKRTAYTKDKEMLQYWGYSYGTIVGQTFASMYPDRVGRLAIDGVVNATDYYSGDWKTDLIDTDNISKNFTLECQAAGPKACPFAQLTLNTTETLLDGFDKTIAAVREIPITGLVNKEPVYVTDLTMMFLLHTGYYKGFFGYKLGSQMLWNAAIRNETYFHVLRSNASEPLFMSDTAQTMIACSDAESRVNETREEYYSYVKFLNKQSPHFGNAITRINMPCHGFNIRPKWRYAGPFGGKTANPILVLSQTLDPITPLASAKGAAALFPGSQMVEAQGIGHCTMGYPSVCAMKQVKKYFYDGHLPQDYTYCPSSVRPFQDLDSVVQMTNNLPLEDRYLMAAGLKISKDFPLWNSAKYGEVATELPSISEAGDWWVEDRGMLSEEHEELVNAQYVY